MQEHTVYNIRAEKSLRIGDGMLINVHNNDDIKKNCFSNYYSIEFTLCKCLTVNPFNL